MCQYAGARGELPEETLARIREVAETANAPVCVGFGLSRPEHISGVLDAGARLAVVGSQLARTIQNALTDPLRPSVLDSFSAALAPLLAAAQDPSELPSCS